MATKINKIAITKPASKISQLKTQADIAFLISVALEVPDFNKIKPNEKQEVASCYQNIKNNGALIKFVELGAKQIFDNFSSLLVESDPNKHSKIMWAKELKAIQNKNKNLISYLQTIIKEEKISISSLQTTDFFINVVGNKRLFFSRTPSLYEGMLNSLIDIFEPCSIGEKTEFISSFIKSKVELYSSPEIIAYFFENIQTPRFKSNFSFKPTFLSVMLKKQLEIGLLNGTSAFDLVTINSITEQMQFFGISPKTELEKYIQILSPYNKSEEKYNIKNLIDEKIDATSDIPEIIMFASNEIDSHICAINTIMSYAQNNNVIISTDTKNAIYSNCVLYIGSLFQSIENAFTYLYEDKMDLSTEKELLEYIPLNPRNLESSVEALLQCVHKLQIIQSNFNSVYLGKILSQQFKNNFTPSQIEKTLFSKLKKEFGHLGCNAHVTTIDSLEQKRQLSSSLKAKTKIKSLVVKI